MFPVTHKKCSKCREVKPVSDFCKDSRAGFQRYCRVCRNAYMRSARHIGKWGYKPSYNKRRKAQGGSE